MIGEIRYLSPAVCVGADSNWHALGKASANHEVVEVPDHVVRVQLQGDTACAGLRDDPVDIILGHREAPLDQVSEWMRDDVSAGGDQRPILGLPLSSNGIFRFPMPTRRERMNRAHDQIEVGEQILGEDGTAIREHVQLGTQEHLIAKASPHPVEVAQGALACALPVFGEDRCGEVAIKLAAHLRRENEVGAVVSDRERIWPRSRELRDPLGGNILTAV